MCGIAGIFNLDGRPVEPAHVKTLTDAIAHRGPDGDGVHCDGAIGLGHRRLAILDLSPAGRQPMAYGEGRYWITFQGEIYNFLELRRELESGGYIFTTQSDTEVIMAAYDKWGPDCQLKFNGMWAFALWDRRERTLFVSRDRFGVKPLLYLHAPRRFVFASELKAFLALDDFTPRESETALRRVLNDFNSIEATEETLLQGVKRLVGGHCLTVRADGAVKVWRWWNTLDHLPQVPRTLAEQAEQFRELFFDACRLRLRSDVPVATCLSGGLDSSAVLCSLARINAGGGAERGATNWQRAFVATFPKSALDESEYAKIAVAHAGAEPHYLPITSDVALDELQRVIFDSEEIYGTLPVPYWMIYRALRQNGVVVSLDGHGADEMLGGYGYYARAALRGSRGFLLAPRRTTDLINTIRQLFEGGPKKPPTRWSLALEGDPLLRFSSRAVRGVYRRTLQPAADQPWVTAAARDGAQLDSNEEAAIDALGPMNAKLYRDFHRAMLPTILRNFDRCSMAHGIEVRMPFMDWRLVCFVFALPEESKVGGGFTKRVLREAMRGVMPEELRTRRSKIGFSSPLPGWFNKSLRDWVRDVANDSEFVHSELWNGEAIRRFVEERQRTGKWSWTECQDVWPFLHAHVWRQTFCKRAGQLATAGAA